jgi:hypothetical protein
LPRLQITWSVAAEGADIRSVPGKAGLEPVMRIAIATAQDPLGDPGPGSRAAAYRLRGGDALRGGDLSGGQAKRD